MLWLALHFPPLPPGTLEAIAAWACQFTPKVSLEPPQGLLLEVQGSLRLFGGRAALMRGVQAGLAAMGWQAGMAAAATPRAALWLSRSSHQDLEKVEIEAASSGEALAFLRSIGIASVGELLRLPREGLGRRCGQALVDDLDRALGAAAEPRAFFSPPARFAAKLELPAEVTHAEGLLFAARRLLVQLEGLLAARQAGIRGFALTLFHDEGTSKIDVGLASPAREAGRLAEVLQQKLSSAAVAQPVEGIGLEAADFEPLPGRSAGLFGDAACEAEGWARLIERLRARLGHDAVGGLATHPDHRPEHAWRRVEPGEWDPHEFCEPGPRPLWLMERRKLKETEFELLVGPERIESGWWDGDEASRDYFVAQMGDQSLAWIYREKEGWFLHGLFA
ncbi:MAG TPA: DNA polymerase Y family protein [Burkholderiales bacterium]|nr:DNA polymerase Y family protein [Burkholderiales bacterium]